jgi:hypothetical protein
MRLKVLVAILCGLFMQFMAGVTPAGNNSAVNYAENKPQPSPEILAAIGQLREIKLMHGDFQQQKNLRILKNPLISRGQFVFSKQNGLHWAIAEPLQRTYLISSKGIKPVDSDATVESPFADNIGKLFASIFSGDLPALEKYFDIYYGNADSYWQLGLRPNNKHIEKIIRQIEISGKKYIHEIKIIETNGDTTGIEFGNLSENFPAGLDVEAKYFK